MAEESAPAGVDTNRPSIARVYDAMLGGKDNFEVDRELRDQLLAVTPDLQDMVRQNRAWLGRAVRWLAGSAKIDQFLDLGSGLPTAENTHEIAQRIDRDAVVVYLDNDPAVIAHGRALLDDERSHFAPGDLTKPDEVFADSLVQKLDFDRPVALLQCGTLYFVPGQRETEDLMRSYVDRLASGSYVAITHVVTPEPDDPRHEMSVAASTKYRESVPNFTPRTTAEVAALFDGLELVEPGLVPLDAWWPAGPPKNQAQNHDLFIGAVGRKP